MAQRAKWSSKYEKGLVDVLSQYKTSHYRGQNGWSSEGWRRIAQDFNQQFPEARFMKSQIQDKEAQLKKEYKAIKSILRKSGVNWKHDASMINTTDEIWDELKEVSLIQSLFIQKLLFLIINSNLFINLTGRSKVRKISK
jgi:hypothetical protein